MRSLLGTLVIATGCFAAGYWAASPKNTSIKNPNNHQNPEVAIERNFDISDLYEPISTYLGWEVRQTTQEKNSKIQLQKKVQAENPSEYPRRYFSRKYPKCSY